MANGLRKLIKRARKEYQLQTRLNRRSNRFGSRLKVEELEERIAPAITAWGIDNGEGDGNDGVADITLRDVGDGFSFTETDGDVWALALVSSVGGAGTALTTGDVVIRLSANDSAATQEIDWIDFGNSASLTTADNVGVVFELVTEAGDGQLNVGAGIAVADTFASSVLGVYGVDVTGVLDEAADVGTTPAYDAAMSARIDMSGSNVDIDGAIKELHVGDLNNLTAASVGTSVTSDDLDGLAGGIGTITTTGDVAALTIDQALGNAPSIGGSITGTWTLNAGSTVDIVAATNISGSITAVTNNLAAITATGGLISGAIASTVGNIGAITAGTSIGGAISAAGTIGAITAGTDISGTITTNDGAGTYLGDLTSLTAGGNVSAAVTIDGTIGDIDITGALSAAITAAEGFVGDVDRNVTGGITAAGSLVATTGGFADPGTATITIGTSMAGDIIATAGDIDVDITISAGGMAATSEITAVAAAADINGTITITGGVVDGATISAGTNVGNIAVQTGDFAGDVEATAGSIGNVTLADVTADVADGSITDTASFTAGTSIGVLTSDGDFEGDVVAQTAGIGGIVSTDGDITANSLIQAAGTIGYLRADIDEDLSGEIAASVTTTAGNISEINAGGDISGTFNAAGTIGAVTTDGQLTGTVVGGTGVTGAAQIDLGISATGELRATTGDISGGVTITEGGMAGLIKADVGNINTAAITINDGGLVADGIIEAGTDIDSAIDINDNGAGVGIDGTINADGNIDGAITVDVGGISATGVVQAAGNIGAGGITVAAGGIAAGATVTAGADIDGAITATTGNIAANITAGTNIDGNVIATAGAITGTVKATGGNLTSTVRAGLGNVANVIVGGNIASATIQAEDDITAITVTGAITGPSTITASWNDIDATGDIGTVAAGGGINVTMAAINIDTVRSGGLAGQDIAGTITATEDIQLIDAGSGTITALVTANEATAASPMTTWISDGYSFAVWAITGAIPASPTEPTANTAITAQLIFDGDAGAGSTPTLEINNLAPSGSTTDIYVTSRADTGAVQLFHDPNVDVYDAPITLTALSASNPITIGTLYVEGSFTDLGGDTDITINNVVVEGGAGGTIAVGVGENIEFGWVEADLAINVTGSGKAGDLILRGSGAQGSGVGYAINGGATVTVDGSLTNVYLGDSSAGFVGDLGTAAASAMIDTLTNLGSIDDMVIDGNVYGSVRATQIGDVEVDGNVGANIAANIDITGRDGIGDITVDGSIGGDAAQTVTIQTTAATASIGKINATGAIGESAGAAGVVTISAGNNIGSVESTDDIGDANSPVIITATNGAIVSVTAGGSYGINAMITAAGDIDMVAATDPDGAQGLIAGSILSYNGNIGNVNTYEADIDADVKATNGNIDGVDILDDPGDAGFGVDQGAVDGDITAGGDINTVTGYEINGIVIAGAATAASPVTVFTIDEVAYALNGTAGPLYGYMFDGGDISITIDNWDGAAALASSVDVSLLTTNALTGVQVSDNFDLLALDFDADSIANGTDILGTVRVDGNLDILNTGILGALIVEEDVNGPIVVADHATSPVTAFAAGSVTAVEDPTLAQMEAVFEDLLGGPVTFGAPADPSTFAIPVDENISFAFGTAAGSLAGIDGAPLVLTGGGLDEMLVTVSGGAITGVEGTMNDSGGVYIDGDLAYVIEAVNLDGLTVTGSILTGGGVLANNVGDIYVGTPIADYIAENGTFADAAAAQAWLDANGNMAGTITSADPGDGLGTGLDGDIGDIDILGNWTGSISATGECGDIEVGQALYGPDGMPIAITGTMDGTLTVGQDCGYFDALLDIVPTADSFIAVAGDLDGGIYSQYGDIGGSGLIMIGGTTGYIEADWGAINADIFLGGSGSGDDIEFYGTAVTGDLVLGAVDGLTEVDIYLYANSYYDDVWFEHYVWDDYGSGAMLVEIPAGAITMNQVDVARVTLFEYDEFELETYTNTSGTVNIDEVFILDTDESDSVELDITMEGSLGTIVASDTNAESSTSSELQAAFLAAYNAAEGTSLTCDVIGPENEPTDLDGALKSDEGNLDLYLYIYTLDNLTGGVIADGDLYVEVDQDVSLGTFGYMVSLNEGVEAYVYANASIGSIAASGDVYAELATEGVVAVDGGTAMQAAVDAYGLSGLPAWFAGGVLSELGDVEIYVLADGNQVLVGGIWPASSDDYVMGTVYAMVGTVDGELTLYGDFGGIVAPVATSLSGVTLNMSDSYQIDMLIAPRANGNGPSGNPPSAQLELLNGEILVTDGHPNVDGFDSVSVVGDGMLAYVDGSDVYVINGLADAAAELNIEGDLSELVVETDWAGAVTVSGNADGELGEIWWLTVNGDIDATTADLTAFNFAGYTHNGDVTGTSPLSNQFVEDGVLDRSNRSVAWTNLAGDDQTLYVNASNAMHAQYSTFFGKLVSVEITGSGAANVVSVNGDYDADGSSADRRALRSMSSQAVRPGHDIFGSDGTANLGSLTANRGWGRATLKNVVVDGYNELLNVDGTVNGLRITGDADWVDVSRSINNAFINVHSDIEYIQSDRMNNVTIFGDVDEFDAIKANKVYITEDVEKMSGQNWNRVAVDGSVHELWMFAGTAQGRLTNSRFGWVNHENIDNRKWIETSQSVTGGDGGDAYTSGGDNAMGGDGGSGAVGNGVLRNINTLWNPVKIVRTIAPGLNPYSSDEYPDEGQG